MIVRWIGQIRNEARGNREREIEEERLLKRIKTVDAEGERS